MSKVAWDAPIRVALRELAEAAGWAAEQPDPVRSSSGYSWFQCCVDEVNKLLGPIDQQIERQAEETMDECFPTCEECAVYMVPGSAIERSTKNPSLCTDCGDAEERFHLEQAKFWGRPPLASPKPGEGKQ